MGIFQLSFLIQCEIFLVLGMMNDFQWKPRHFIIMLRESGSDLPVHLFWQNSNITLEGRMGMVPPHHCQGG